MITMQWHYRELEKSNYHDISHLSAELWAVNSLLIPLFSALTPYPHKQKGTKRHGQSISGDNTPVQSSSRVQGRIKHGGITRLSTRETAKQPKKL